MSKATNAAATILCSILAYDNFLIVSVDQDYVDSLDQAELAENLEAGELRWSFKDTGVTVGVSPEALELLQKVTSDNTEVVDGEPDQRMEWNEGPDGWEFSYAGPPHTYFHPENVQTRAFSIGAYVEIENDIPDGAKEAIDFDEMLESLADIVPVDDAEEALEQQTQSPPAAI